MKISRTIFLLVVAVFALAIYGDLRAQTRGPSSGISPFCTAYSVDRSDRWDIPLATVYLIETKYYPDGRVRFQFTYGSGYAKDFMVPVDRIDSVWSEISRCYGGPVSR